MRSYRSQLMPGEDVIDTAAWAGSVPQVGGIAPRVRGGSASMVRGGYGGYNQDHEFFGYRQLI